MDLPVAVGMEQHQVFQQVRATTGAPHNVVGMPPCCGGNRVVTDPAFALLFLPEEQIFPPFSERMAAPAVFKVFFPGRVVRIRVFADLDLPTDGHLTRRKQPDACWRSGCVNDLADKGPCPSRPGLEIFLADPGGTTLGMPTFCPVPDGPKQRSIDRCEGFCTYHMPVIASPSANQRIELANEITSCGLFVRLEERPRFVQEGVHILLGWRNEQFPPHTCAGVVPRNPPPGRCA